MLPRQPSPGERSRRLGPTGQRLRSPGGTRSKTALPLSRKVPRARALQVQGGPSDGTAEHLAPRRRAEAASGSHKHKHAAFPRAAPAKMGRAASNAAPADPKAIMAARRAAYREEQLLPDVKWACFEEQRKHEDFAAVRPSVNMEPYAIDATRVHETRSDYEAVRTASTTHRSSSPRSRPPSRPRTRGPTKESQIL